MCSAPWSERNRFGMKPLLFSLVSVFSCDDLIRVCVLYPCSSLLPRDKQPEPFESILAKVYFSFRPCCLCHVVRLTHFVVSFSRSRTSRKLIFANKTPLSSFLLTQPNGLGPAALAASQAVSQPNISALELFCQNMANSCSVCCAWQSDKPKPTSAFAPFQTSIVPPLPFSSCRFFGWGKTFFWY
jgi:hypothetical protein